MKTVVVLVDRHPRSKRLSEALALGAAAVGWGVEITDEQHTEPRGDLCVAYGWLPNHETLTAYLKAGKQYLHVDLGYWERKRKQGDYGGNHKVSLNARHPVAYFRRQRPATRVDGAPDVLLWRRDGRHIVVAGLSAKGARSIGRPPLDWELSIMRALRRVTDRPIVYRPKPSWRDAGPIHGAGYSPPHESIHDALKGAWALVTNYSNAAIDALAAGIPVYAEDGVAKALSVPSLADIENPRELSIRERKQFLADVGFCHWTKAEISDGTMFRQFVSDGLIAP
jgi:hypothetical protein